MNTLSSRRVADLLDQLHRDAEAADGAMMQEIMDRLAASEETPEQFVEAMIAQERADYQTAYRDRATNFLSVTPRYGRFLYAIARAATGAGTSSARSWSRRKSRAPAPTSRRRAWQISSTFAKATH